MCLCSVFRLLLHRTLRVWNRASTAPISSVCVSSRREQHACAFIETQLRTQSYVFIWTRACVSRRAPCVFCRPTGCALYIYTLYTIAMSYDCANDLVFIAWSRVRLRGVVGRLTLIDLSALCRVHTHIRLRFDSTQASRLQAGSSTHQRHLNFGNAFV